MKDSKSAHKVLEEKVRLLEFQLKQLKAKTREPELTHDMIDKLYQLVIKYFPIPMGIYSYEGKIEYFNDKATEVFGYTIDDIPDLDNWWKKAYPDEVYRQSVIERWNILISEALRTKKGLTPEEFTITCKDGKKLFTTIYGREFGDKFLIVISDNTNLKKAEESIKLQQHELELKNEELLKINQKIKRINNQLVKAKEKAEESDHLKSAFLSNMSHEIRTPLNAIMGFSEFLEREVLPEDKRKLFTKIIHQRGNDLLKIINDILDISKIESGQLNLFEKNTDLNLVMDDIFQFFEARRLFKKENVVELRLKHQLSCADSTIVTDSTRLKQIFINLVDNSLKFTRSGFIEIGCQLSPKKELLFYVRDTGIGIPKNKYHFIFKRFSQATDPFRANEFGGSGLGLSICKGLVNLMKGNIWFESEEKKGTTFYFTIPYVPADSQKEPLDIPVKKNYNWLGKTILLIEDDKWSADYISAIMSTARVKLTKATNGKQALKLFGAKAEFDLVLMDIQLPDMDGYELTRKMKQRKPQQKIIAQTAFASEEDRKLCMEAGCIDYISKPIEQIKFLEMIDRYMGR